MKLKTAQLESRAVTQQQKANTTRPDVYALLSRLDKVRENGPGVGSPVVLRMMTARPVCRSAKHQTARS